MAGGKYVRTLNEHFRQLMVHYEAQAVFCNTGKSIEDPVGSMVFLDHLFFLIFIQAFSDKLFHFWGNNCPLPGARSLVEVHVFALAVLSDSVPGNP